MCVAPVACSNRQPSCGRCGTAPDPALSARLCWRREFGTGCGYGIQCGKERGANMHHCPQRAQQSRWRHSLAGSSKPVRCGNPTLGRFDSGAAPLSRLRRPERARGGCDGRVGLSRSAARDCWRPPGTVSDCGAIVARASWSHVLPRVHRASARSAGSGSSVVPGRRGPAAAVIGRALARYQAPFGGAVCDSS